jgi:hypothetical protein
VALACFWVWCVHRPDCFCHWLPVQSSAAELGQFVFWPQLSVAVDDFWLLLLRRVAIFYSVSLADQICLGICRRTDSRLRVVYMHGGFVVSLSSIGMSIERKMPPNLYMASAVKRAYG